MAVLTFPLGASEPIGRITSANPFQLRGQTVQVAGVPSWNALVGDEIVAGSGSLVLTFKDGSRVVIAANSRAKIAADTNKGVEFRLLSGWMTVTRSAKSPIRYFSGQTEFTPAAGTASSVAVGRTVSMSDRVPPPPPPPSTPMPTSIR